MMVPRGQRQFKKLPSLQESLRLKSISQMADRAHKMNRTAWRRMYWWYRRAAGFGHQTARAKTARAMRVLRRSQKPRRRRSRRSTS